jgi:hypothetical protein
MRVLENNERSFPLIFTITVVESEIQNSIDIVWNIHSVSQSCNVNNKMLYLGFQRVMTAASIAGKNPNHNTRKGQLKVLE